VPSLSAIRPFQGCKYSGFKRLVPMCLNGYFDKITLPAERDSDNPSVAQSSP